jgi:hypothetical protein
MGYLTEAREAIISAGGEPRAAWTMDEYRKTALWVSGDLTRNFAWLPGVSYSAHSEARKHSMTYEQFAARPLKVDQIRATADHPRGGAAGTDGPPERIVSNWTPDQKAEAAREILADPDMADQVLADQDTSHAAGAALVRKAQARVREGKEWRDRNLPPETRDVNRRLGERDTQLALGQICDKFAKDIAEALPGAGVLAENERFWLSGARDNAANALAALSDYIQNGPLSDEAAEMLRNVS